MVAEDGRDRKEERQDRKVDRLRMEEVEAVRHRTGAVVAELDEVVERVQGRRAGVVAGRSHHEMDNRHHRPKTDRQTEGTYPSQLLQPQIAGPVQQPQLAAPGLEWHSPEWPRPRGQGVWWSSW